jgi:DNA-directed RNA polymerase subunit RPC12/RpoP
MKKRKVINMEIEKEKKPKAKIVFEERIVCPHCEKLLILKKLRTQTQKAVPAEYEEKTVVEKDKQTTLNDVDENVEED